MIVTISRQPGCQGEAVAKKLAEEKGFAYLDKKILKEKLLGHQIPELLFERFDEKNPGYLSRFSEKRERYFNRMKMVILDFASKGDCVLVGRGTQILFAGVQGAVKIRITAPRQVRIRQLAKKRGCSEKEADKIERRIYNERKGFYRTFFNEDPESYELYDLVINNQYLDSAAVVSIISSMIDVKQGMDVSLDDLIIKQKVIDEILYKRKIPIYSLHVEVVNGDVFLSGSVHVKENIILSRDAVLTISGVNGVHTEKIVVPRINTYGK